MKPSHTARRCIIAIAASAAAIQPISAQAASPVAAPRPLGAPVATSPALARATSVHPLADGRLLINDGGGRRVVIADSTLAVLAVISDTSSSAPYPYGTRAAVLPLPGDSALLVEMTTPSMHLIDPAGRVVRTGAVPNARDVSWLMPSRTGMAGVDSRGRFVHRAAGPRAVRPEAKVGEWITYKSGSDSIPVVRVDPTTRRGDTLTWLRRAALTGVMTATSPGRSFTFLKGSPFPIVDDFALLSDGTIAVLRGADYRLELIDADGARRSVRIPYQWERLTDSTKQAVIDSIRIAREAAESSPPQRLAGATAGGSTGGGGGGGVGAPPADRPTPPAGALDLSLSDFPDYRPALFEWDGLQPTRDGQLWIRTNAPSGVTGGGEVVYDVVDREGKLIDRIRLPETRTVVGFDRRGHVYLANRAAPSQALERVRWR